MASFEFNHVSYELTCSEAHGSDKFIVVTVLWTELNGILLGRVLHTLGHDLRQGICLPLEL